MTGYVFGYGSLSAEVGAPPRVATLAGHVRVWNVAMDNRAEIGGYKYYADPATGERPAVCVTFVDLAIAAGVDCVGFLLPVSDTELAALDRRERNYDRVDVTDLIRPDADAEVEPKATVWTYMGRREARERYASAVAAGRAVIARSYMEIIESSFRAAGLWPRYVTSTRSPECPVSDLRRVEVTDQGLGPPLRPARG